MFRTALIAVMLLTICVASQARTLHKCKMPDGSFRYSDTGCPKEADTVKKKNMRGPEPERFLSQTEIDTLKPLLIQAVASLTGVRTSVAEYYLSNGNWPKNITQMGFTPDSMNSSLINQVEITNDNGNIEATLSEQFGQEKKVNLTPRFVLGGTQAEWRCTSNVSKQLLAKDSPPYCEPEN